MKKNQFNGMTAAELNDKVVELKKELFNLRFQLATGQLQDTMAIANTKRDIARAKTALRSSSSRLRRNPERRSHYV